MDLSVIASKLFQKMVQKKRKKEMRPRSSKPQVRDLRTLEQFIVLLKHVYLLA